VLTANRPAIPFANRKKYFGRSFQFSIFTFKKEYHPSGNLNFNNLSIFQTLRLRILKEKILPISLQILWAVMG